MQNYTNHRRYVPGFHFVLSTLIIIVLLMSAFSLGQVYNKEQWLRGGIIPLLTSVILVVMYWYVRTFPVTVQTRAIRAEENMRHYIMTGKQLDSRLTMGQIVALRFAGDEEYIALSAKAANEGLAPDAIKQLIKNWRTDDYRC
ncbi:MAG: hypothetical protein H7257_03080 [Taibaiella sp.]|nr:hypothetical protein [Taibaiella sp.]